MEGDEPLPEDSLRCKRTDGRDWRCKRRVVDGKSFCDTHLNRTTTTTTTQALKPRVRFRVRLPVKPKPVEDSQQPKHDPKLDPVPVPDHLRCHRNDGRSWRCKRQAIEGQTLCEIHQNKTQRKPRLRDAPPNKGDKEPEKPSPAPVSENLPEKPRCSRSNGKDWRCRAEAMEGHTLCDIHFKKVKNGGKPSTQKREKQNNSTQKRENEITSTLKREKRKPTSETEKSLPVPENLRCTRNDGRQWRCKRRVMEGQTLCEEHFNKVKIRQLRGGNEKREREGKGKVRRRESTPVPEDLRCARSRGREWRCKRQVVEGETLCESHLKKVKKTTPEKPNVDVKVELSIEKEGGNDNNNPLPGPVGEDLMCKRTDGRGWRCKRQVLEGKTLCEIHYEQGKLRQLKVAVPESLKIKRGDGDKVEKRLKRKRALEVLESNSNKGMKRMRAELIRVFLRREIIERSKKREKDSEEVTRDLPYGLMAIPPAPPTQFLDNAGSLGIKVGVHCSNSTVNRRFRSKNIEPPLISSLKVVPYAGNVGKVRKNGKKKCHWCQRNENLSLTKCSSCRKRVFCSDCMKERCIDPEEVRLRCPVCCGSCDCKACLSTQSNNVQTKEILKEQCKGSKFQQLLYLINFLLPVLEQINQEQSVDLEMEAKFKGQNLSEVEIQQADVSCGDRCCCNNCKSPILDFHRSCPNCSYNLCLSCCREYSEGGSLGGTVKSSFQHPNRTNTHFPGLVKYSENMQKSDSLQSIDTADLATSAPSTDSTACHRISCPPLELGGCDNSLLDLRCIFPLYWTKELEVSAREMASEHDFRQVSDDPVPKELHEAARRKDSDDNFLYCPSTSDDNDSVLAHFQKHWQKGHPVKVQNVLRGELNSSWDPLAMFCSFLEKGFSNCGNVTNLAEAANLSDWYEVDIVVKESFTMSLEEGYIHRRHEKLKLKAKISSALSRRLFEGHYGQILRALPLQEYTNLRSGLLNLATRLPEDFPESKLGPNLCISYGSREDVEQGEMVTKLCYNSYDVVDILVHAGDASCSTEQLNRIKTFLRRNKPKDKGGSNAQDLESTDTRMNSEISAEAGEPHRVLEGTPLSGHRVVGASSSSAATNDASGVDIRNNNSPAKVHGSDTDSDASVICSGTSDSPEKSVDQMCPLDRIESSNLSDRRTLLDPCGAQWDVFRRQDVPRLLEYITKHVDELSDGYGRQKNVHPIFDGSFYLNEPHKVRLKEEFEIEPWTFSQCLGEAVFIPAGCPYQIKNTKSCVNVAVGFISPENASESIKLMEEIHVLPNSNHKAKQEKLEVGKMTICTIDEAIKEIYRLKSEVSRHGDIRDV